MRHLKVKYWETQLAVLVVIMAMFLLISGCSGVRGLFVVTGSGTLLTRNYEYADFARIEAGSLFQVSVTKAETYSVNLTADDNLFDYIDIQKIGNTLHIQLKGTNKYLSTTLRATITMPDVFRFALSGASTGSINGFQFTHPVTFAVSGASSLSQENMTVGDADLEISGASKITGAIKMEEANIDVSGASRIELAGTASNLNIKSSGASRVELADLISVDVHINLSGISTATVNPGGKLDGELSGLSTLYYLGNPVLGEMKISSGSHMTRK